MGQTPGVFRTLTFRSCPFNPTYDEVFLKLTPMGLGISEDTHLKRSAIH
jgi:hypothetical protein